MNASLTATQRWLRRVRGLLLLTLASLLPFAATAQGSGIFVHRDDGGKYASSFALKHGAWRTTAILDTAAFGSGGLLKAGKLVLNLAPDLILTASRQRVDARGERGHSWFGSIDGATDSLVVITRVTSDQEREAIGVHVDHEGRRFAVLPTPSGLHEIVEIDDASFAPDDPEPGSIKPGQAGPGNESGRLDGYLNKLAVAADDEWQLFRRLTREATTAPTVQRILEDGSQIDVLMLYTNGAGFVASHSLYPSSWQFWINLYAQTAIDLANQSFVNSQVPTYLNLVSAPLHVDYDDFASTIDQDLAALRDFDNVLDEAHAWRYGYAADIVLMLTGYGGDSAGKDWCGMAYASRQRDSLGATRSDFEASQAANAFAIVVASCAVGSTYTLAHEVGHLLGGKHDRYELPQDVSPDWDQARGFVLQAANGKAVRSVMAYSTQCQQARPQFSCPRLLRWSDPDDLSQFGLPLGIPVGLAGTADTRSALIETIVWVSRYRWWGCRHVNCDTVP